MVHGTDDEKIELEDFLAKQVDRELVRDIKNHFNEPGRAGLDLPMSFKVDKNV